MHLVLAYIDPGSGSLMIQALIAGLVAAPFVLRQQLARLVRRVRGQAEPVDELGADGHRSGRVIEGGPEPDPGSWRDPFGFVYRRDGILLRQVNSAAAAEWEATEGSGFLRRLQTAGLLIGHEPAPLDWAADPSLVLTVIRPEPVPFISYPYEWTFGQLKAAALLTLEVQCQAMTHGLELRDASAYNVQFIGVRPVFIDTLSFRRATPGAPWIAYRQFCEHFLAPLALMARRDIRLGGLLRDHLDGIPLDLAARLLPARTRLSLGLGSHIHLHARAQRRHADRPEAAGEAATRKMSPTRQAALHDSLVRLIGGLDWTPAGTEWADYGTASSYDDASATAKDAGRRRPLICDRARGCVGSGCEQRALLRHRRRYGAGSSRWTSTRRPASATGGTSWPEPRRGSCRSSRILRTRPRDGWDARERQSLFDRAEGATLLALALVHHLAIGRNVPLPMLSATLARLGDRLIIEWVPKEDPMVQRLLATREDVFPEYTIAGFEAALSTHWRIEGSTRVGATPRTIYEAVRR